MLFLLVSAQDAMRKAEQASEDDCTVRIVLVAPPLYVLTTFTLDKVTSEDTCCFLVCSYSNASCPNLATWKLREVVLVLGCFCGHLHLQDKGISVLERAIKAAAGDIEKHKGKLTVKEAPRAVSY